MSQSCCSLGFLSQNSLWKTSTFRGYKGIYNRVHEGCEKTFFCKTGCSGNSLATGISREFRSRNNWLARLAFLPCRPLSFLHASHVWHFGESTVVSHSWDPVARILWNAHTLEFFTLSYTQSLLDSHLNTGYLIAEIQANMAWNKANTRLNKFNLTISPFGYSVTKP